MIAPVGFDAATAALSSASVIAGEMFGRAALRTGSLPAMRTWVSEPEVMTVPVLVTAVSAEVVSWRDDDEGLAGRFRRVQHRVADAREQPKRGPGRQ